MGKSIRGITFRLLSTIREWTVDCLFLKQTFHATAENPGEAIKGIGTSFVDVLVPLLIHLD